VSEVVCVCEGGVSWEWVGWEVLEDISLMLLRLSQTVASVSCACEGGVPACAECDDMGTPGPGVLSDLDLS
jgi:hypothetical protein